MLKGPLYNIILITIDCLRADHIGCLGYSKNTTPNIDKLARRGALFTCAISNGPTTHLSFPAIFTSTYPLMHEIKDREISLNENYITLAEVLRRAGYSTWGFLSSNPFLSSHFRYNTGFEYFDENKKSTRQAEWKEFQKIMYEIQRHLCRLSGKYCSIRALLYCTTRASKNATYYYPIAEIINEKVLSKLRNSLTNRFFLAIHYMDAHTPYLEAVQHLLEPRNSIYLFRESLKIHYKTTHNPSSITDEDRHMAILLYDAAIQYVDRHISALLRELEKEGIGLDNTYVIITSDHGEGFGEHGFFSHKEFLYDELLHVPLIICGPNIKPKIIDNLIGLIDIAPTILDLAGLKIPKSFLGRSFAPLLLEDEEREIRGYVISEGVIRLSCRTRNWKYIVSLSNNKVREELFNLKSDPAETKNVIKEYENYVKYFRSCLYKHLSYISHIRARMHIKRKSKELREKWLKKNLRSMNYTLIET